MSEIPADIRETARRLAAAQCGSDDQCQYPGECACRDDIARAILAERETCAKMVEGFSPVARDTEWDEGVNYAKQWIAKAIRGR